LYIKRTRGREVRREEEGEEIGDVDTRATSTMT